MGHTRLVGFIQRGDTVEVVTEELHEYLLIKWQLLFVMSVQKSCLAGCLGDGL